jgi:hypothetical protein
LSKSNLKGLLQSIQDAIVGSQELIQQQHIQDLNKFLNDDGTPVTHNLKIPRGVDDNGETVYTEQEIPLMILSPPSSLKIKRMKVKFVAIMSGHGKMGTGEKCDDEECIHLHLGGGSIFNRGAKVNCEIEFEGTEPPEGWMRINDELVKIIQ